ncbi:amidase [Nocardioides sp. CER19]|uniref:amidase n=1 Tax=Nocardioides sp. CER19 TaxID=3038538 RepID=UPI002446ADD4|nr:amidase [Nocardioides sp. CER19]MDH2413078.1 amidase [Nocardioides sp. CER19]
MSDLDDLSLLDAAAAIRAGDISPVELTEHVLARIEATEPTLHAYATVDADGARSAASAAERAVLRGDELGALHGVPMGVKDLFDTAGMRTTYGSPRYDGHVPDRDATAVARLRAAGAIVLGKHTTHEFAWGGRTDSASFGATHNPHRHGHIAGGSSGGSGASVAAGSCLGAIGTDTAGSVRIPAALSGCVGFKPSRGRISLAGVMPLSPSLDHVGALARTVADAAAIADAVAGHDPADERTLHLTDGLAPAQVASARVAVPGGWFQGLLHPAVREAVTETASTLVGLGVEVETVDFVGDPDVPHAVLTRILFEAGLLHRPAFSTEPSSFGPDLAELLSLPSPTPLELAAMEAAIARFSAQLLSLLGDYDALLVPTVPVPAPELGQRSVSFDTHTDTDTGAVDVEIEHVLTRLTSPLNAAGLPAVSVPAGAADGLPVAVQVVGRPYDDATALGIAALVERRSGH